MSSHPLAGRTVLHAGPGSGGQFGAHRPACPGIGCGSADRHAGLERGHQATVCVADICTLPLATEAVDDSVAAFVLNHPTDPVPGLADPGRVARPGG